MLPVALFLVILVLGVYFVKFRVSKERRRLLELAALVPNHKGALPFVGHAIEIFRGIDGNKIFEKLVEVTDATEKAGGVLVVWIGPYPQFIINDPGDAMTVLNSCLKKHYLYNTGSKFFGEGLFSADVPTWKRNRKLLNPTFSQHVLESFQVIFNKFGALLAQNLEPNAGKGAFDPRKYLVECTLETVCQTAVGVSLDDKSLIGEKYKRAVEAGFDIVAHKMTRFWLHSDSIYGLTPLKKFENEILTTLHDTSRTILHKRRLERQQAKLANTSPRRFMAFLDLLLDMAEDGLFTDDEIRHELDTIITAGHDTSARAFSIILVFLGSHPEAQEKVYDEVMTVIGNSSDVNSDDLKKLVYTEAVVKEALRLCPPAPLIGRHIDKEIKLKNYTLPAGSDTIITIYGINRLPVWGPDRYQFRPERWLDPASLPQIPGAHSTFSMGRRGCIGKSYALMAAKTNLVHLIRKFHIRADCNKLKIEFNILLKFLDGYQISLELRK